jgi:hypothetical protein
MRASALLRSFDSHFVEAKILTLRARWNARVCTAAQLSNPR